MEKTQTTLDEVLRRIDEAMLHEEMALPVYTKHIVSATEYSNLSEAQQIKLKQGLEVLARESRGHITLLEKIKNLIS